MSDDSVIRGHYSEILQYLCICTFMCWWYQQTLEEQTFSSLLVVYSIYIHMLSTVWRVLKNSYWNTSCVWVYKYTRIWLTCLKCSMRYGFSCVCLDTCTGHQTLVCVSSCYQTVTYCDDLWFPFVSFLTCSYQFKY